MNSTKQHRKRSSQRVSVSNLLEDDLPLALLAYKKGYLHHQQSSSHYTLSSSSTASTLLNSSSANTSPRNTLTKKRTNTPKKTSARQLYDLQDDHYKNVLKQAKTQKPIQEVQVPCKPNTKKLLLTKIISSSLHKLNIKKITILQ